MLIILTTFVCCACLVLTIITKKCIFFFYGDKMKCYCNSKPNEKDIVKQKRSEVS